MGRTHRKVADSRLVRHTQLAIDEAYIGGGASYVDENDSIKTGGASNRMRSYGARGGTGEDSAHRRAASWLPQRWSRRSIA